MSVDWERRVIPVWRSSALSSTLPESKPITNSTVKFSGKDLDASIIQNHLNSWRNEKSIGTTADLLSFAHINEFRDSLIEPAEFIIHNSKKFPKTIRLLAESLLKNSSSEVVNNRNLVFDNFDLVHRAEVARIKQRLLIDPKNSIALMDLGRLYASQGQTNKAEGSVIKALHLSPDNRFILRSGARFLIHAGLPEKAAYYISKSPALHSDPWLLATHVAIETILGKGPKYFKRSVEIIKANTYRPEHISELASSIGTLEARDGDLKSAKKMFNKSLIDPNANSLAQAFWSTKKFGINLDIDENFLLTPYTHEARYYKHIFNVDFEAAIQQAADWYMDEPYTVRPLRAATYIACVIGDYEAAVKFSNQALKIDSTDIEVLNNLVYALASQNLGSEAVQRLKQVAKIEKSKIGHNGAQTLANWGMLQFIAGNFDEGEKYYKIAIKQFSEEKNYFSMAQAAAFMATESFKTDNPNAKRLFNEAKTIISKYPSKISTKILELGTLSPAHKLKLKVQDVLRPQLNFISDTSDYDPDRNLLIIK